MLFITEDTLRYEYKKSPFNSYLLKKGNKLTPQARQFLIDFRIKIINEKDKKSIENKSPKIETKVFEDDDKLEKALIIKELALNIRELDNQLAIRLNKLSLEIYKEKEYKLESVEIRKKEAFEIYIKMDLINPYLSAFISINNAINKLIKIDENLANKLEAILYDWFIKISKGGDSY